MQFSEKMDKVVEGNVVENNEIVSITIANGASPSLTEHFSCGNGQNLNLGGDAAAEIDDTNEICADEPAG